MKKSCQGIEYFSSSAIFWRKSKIRSFPSLPHDRFGFARGFVGQRALANRSNFRQEYLKVPFRLCACIACRLLTWLIAKVTGSRNDPVPADLTKELEQ
jgi:hypothetical protein